MRRDTHFQRVRVRLEILRDSKILIVRKVRCPLAKSKHEEMSENLMCRAEQASSL